MNEFWFSFFCNKKLTFPLIKWYENLENEKKTKFDVILFSIVALIFIVLITLIFIYVL